MAYRSLREFMAKLEAAGELVRVSESVSSVLEMTEIQRRLLANGGPAVLFENVIRADGERSSMPCLVNLFGTVKRVAMGVTLEGKARTTAKELRERLACLQTLYERQIKRGADHVTVSRLRLYSRYMNPRLGTFSADTWTVAATMIRNILLNWLVLLPLLLPPGNTP